MGRGSNLAVKYRTHNGTVTFRFCPGLLDHCRQHWTGC